MVDRPDTLQAVLLQRSSLYVLILVAVSALTTG